MTDVPALPANSNWSEWTFEQALAAVTGEGADLHAPANAAWFTFNSSPTAADSYSYNAFGKYYYGANANSATIQAWADAVAALNEMMPGVYQGKRGALDRSTLSDMQTAVDQMTQWMKDTGDSYQSWATNLDSTDSSFKGSAASVIQFRLQQNADGLNNIHDQVTVTHGKSVSAALANAQVALNTFTNHMANTWAPISGDMASAVTNAMNQVNADIYNYLVSNGIVKGTPQYQLDSMDDAADTDGLKGSSDGPALTRIQLVISSYPEGDLGSSATWDKINKNISTNILNNLLKPLDSTAAAEIADLATVYQATTGALIPITTPSVSTPPSPVPAGGDPNANDPNITGDGKNITTGGGGANTDLGDSGGGNSGGGNSSDLGANGSVNATDLGTDGGINAAGAGSAGGANGTNAGANGGIQAATLSALPAAGNPNLIGGTGSQATTGGGAAGLSGLLIPSLGSPGSTAPNGSIAGSTVAPGGDGAFVEPDIGGSSLIKPDADVSDSIVPPAAGSSGIQLPTAGTTGVGTAADGAVGGGQVASIGAADGAVGSGLAGLGSGAVGGGTGGALGTGAFGAADGAVGHGSLGTGSGLGGGLGAGGTMGSQSGFGSAGGGLASGAGAGAGDPGISNLPTQMSGGSLAAGGPSGAAGASAGSGGVPFFPPMMGGGGQGGGEKPQERERQTWLSEDEGVWGTDVAVGSGVIGRVDEDGSEADEPLVPSAPGRWRRPVEIRGRSDKQETPVAAEEIVTSSAN